MRLGLGGTLIMLVLSVIFGRDFSGCSAAAVRARRVAHTQSLRAARPQIPRNNEKYNLSRLY